MTDNGFDKLPRLANGTLEPLAVRVTVAAELLGLGKTAIYELIESGDIEIVKLGRATLIPYRNLKKLIGQQE
ncbi:helix-turn-helix domain-containing protein [Rhizorhabdus dicambivorans]|uniref:DNA-binding protein n=1 Tax=Rhizorhabdus dicambivorans TaxID=1850238 RepID=A0A2A4FTV4_9SPHN|nr:helix-turn-helix domain-containing protein [Rhizorhabdus dicambivorans]ATE65757.1 DNA-binding protein [Rhizorhabdus dicambivorans]PCE41160.1 DNA-binding protein [Rhizorhabdus dicambivorans]